MNSSDIFIGLFGGAVALALTIVLMWHILHIILCKKYDEILFREPYFRITELTVYSSWPLSLFRSMGYILLLAAPSLATKRRFKGVVLDLDKDYFLVFLCKAFLWLVGVSLLFVLIIIVWGNIL